MNLTAEEYRQLEAIKVLYPWAKWIARCQYHSLQGFDKKPSGSDFCYRDDNGVGVSISLPMAALRSLTQDSEPLNIDEALEGRGCKHCDPWGDELLEMEKEVDICPHCGRRLEGEE